MPERKKEKGGYSAFLEGEKDLERKKKGLAIQTRRKFRSKICKGGEESA